MSESHKKNYTAAYEIQRTTSFFEVRRDEREHYAVLSWKDQNYKNYTKQVKAIFCFEVTECALCEFEEIILKWLFFTCFCFFVFFCSPVPRK